MYFFGPKPKPKRLVKGTDWRKRGETLSWKLVDFDENNVSLSGPGPCRGMLFLDRRDFEKNYERS